MSEIVPDTFFDFTPHKAEKMNPEVSPRELACIYCPTETQQTFRIDEGSLEHVILSSLGGRKGSRNVCCTKCNNRLGDEIDAPTAATFAPLGNLLNIKRDRKGAAPSLETSEVIGEQALTIAPGGRFKLKKSATITSSSSRDGNTAFAIHANTVEDAERLRQNYLKQFGQNAEAITERYAISTPAPAIKFQLKLCDEEKRSATKMLLTLLATCSDPSRIRSADLQQAVQYVKGEHPHFGKRVEPWTNIDIPEIPEDYKFGHTAIVVASATSKLLIGVLILYGTVSVTALLSDSWSGPTMGRRYSIDPCTGTSEVCDIEEERFAQSYPKRARPSNDEYREYVESLLAEVQRRQREILVNEIFEDVMASVPDDAAEDSLKEAVATLTERLVKEIYGIPHVRKI